jgi:hypothetical protein
MLIIYLCLRIFPGGYQYRLCAKESNLTEACFQSTPIPFVGKMYLQYRNASRQLIDSSYASYNGTGYHTADGDTSFLSSMPGTWAVNPIPDFKQKEGTTPADPSGHEFPPPCNDNENAPTKGLCSGERPFHLAIIDTLMIPEHTTPGDYVLGFRWDVEETAQVWSSCSDITIAA